MGSKGQLTAVVVVLFLLASGFVPAYGDTIGGESSPLPGIQIGPRDERTDDPPAPATPFDVPSLADGNIARDYGPDGIQNTADLESLDDNAVPFGSRSLSPSKEHNVLTDGLYGAQSQWRGNGGTLSTEIDGVLEKCGAINCAAPCERDGNDACIPDRGTEGGVQCAYAGIYWTVAPVDIYEIALGSNNQKSFRMANGSGLDITNRPFVMQYTTDTFTPVALTNDCINDLPPCDDSDNYVGVNWITLGLANAHINGRGFQKTFRHRYSIDPPLIGVRGIRFIKVENDDIDEIEVGNAPNALGPEPSTQMVLQETGGPYTTPAASGDVPTVDESNLARHADVTVFASSQAGIANLNDGSYGPAWIGANGAAGNTYAGFYFDDTEFPDGQSIQEVAISRDNTGVLNDRADGVHTIEYVPATDTFDPASEAAVDGANWTLPILYEACAHLDLGANCQGTRHRYRLLLPEVVRAIRVVTTAGNAFDELEVGPLIAADLDTHLTALGGFTFLGALTSVPSPNPVPNFATGRNVARSPDSVPFAVLTPFNSHQGSGQYPTFRRIKNGFYGDANGWVGHPSTVTTPRSFASYAGVYWTDGLKRIEEIQESRDNKGGHADRHDGAFAVEYTTDTLDFEFGGENEPSVAKARWLPIGTLREHPLVLPAPTAEIPNPQFEDLLRHSYELNTPVEARAIRVLSWPTTGSTAFDELVFIGDPVVGEGSITLPDCGAPTGGCLTSSAAGQLAGDCNQDGGVDLSDVVCLLGFLFQNNPVTLPCATTPANLSLMDCNGDGSIDLSDAIYKLGYLFQGSDEPVQGVNCFGIADCPPNLVGCP